MKEKIRTNAVYVLLNLVKIQFWSHIFKWHIKKKTIFPVNIVVLRDLLAKNLEECAPKSEAEFQFSTLT